MLTTTISIIKSDEKEDIKIVIGGGGSTGVELSAEIQNWFNEIKITRKKLVIH